MTTGRSSLFGLALVLGLAAPWSSQADVIHLTNGSRLEVDAWRDAGDAIEFSMGGGIVRVPKSGVLRIEGAPTREDLPMGSAGPMLEPRTAASRMVDLLGEAVSLPGLPMGARAEAFRKLRDQWRALQVPSGLRDAHTRGGQGIERLADLTTSEGRPDRARVRAVVDEMVAVVVEALTVAEDLAGEK